MNKIPDIDLKALRKKLGLTQKEFAETYMIPYETLKNWEQGEYLNKTTSRLLLYIINELPNEIEKILKNIR